MFDLQMLWEKGSQVKGRLQRPEKGRAKWTATMGVLWKVLAEHFPMVPTRILGQKVHGEARLEDRACGVALASRMLHFLLIEGIAAVFPLPLPRSPKIVPRISPLRCGPCCTPAPCLCVRRAVSKYLIN